MFKNERFEVIIEVLNSGGLILFPTDTIWGIGCDACNAAAIDKVYVLKNRDKKKGFVLLADSIEMVKDYVTQVHPRIDTLLQYHRRPLTVVYDHARNLPVNACAPDGSVAFRVVNDEFCKALIHTFGKPLVATSANISDEPFPTNFEDIKAAIFRGVDYVVKYRQNEKQLNEPSVIVRLDKKGELEFIRD